MSGTPGKMLDGGLALREATDADLEDIVKLQVEAFGAADEPLVRTYLAGPGASIADWMVVTDGPRIVSACALLDVGVRLDGLAVPAGQIEYVATDPAYQRRGLIRAQFDRQHERSAARGHVVQFIGGIPYFYRRFGYGYGVSHPDMFTITGEHLRPDPDVHVRPATEADLPGLRALDARRSAAGLVAVRDDVFWRRQLLVSAANPPVEATEHTVVVERQGAVVAWAALERNADHPKIFLGPTVTPSDGVTDALLAYGLGLAQGSMPFIALEQPGTDMGARIRELGTLLPYGLGVYVRIPDPVAFLQAIRPVLSARLTTSSYARERGEVQVSLYRTGFVIGYAAGVVTDVRAVPGVEDTWDAGECGVAPDWFPALALGRWGAAGLAERIDDVHLGRHAAVLEVLFPRIPTDIVGDF